jgi:hypothetical protein
LSRLERSKALQNIKKRKADTRRKIEFGGLVIKAGMDEFSKDIILGALLDSKQQIENSEDGKDIKNLFKMKGQDAFLKSERS